MMRFSDTPSWTEYRTLLADVFGISLSREPVESRQLIRGHEVRIDEWPASGSARGTLVMAHGGGGNGRILAPLADQMAERGWRVLAPDLPGYGLTRPAPGYRGDFGEWPAVLAHLAQSQQGPVALLGASMGGLTAVLAAQMSPNVRAVIATTLLDLSDPDIFVRAARWPWLGRLSLIAMAAAPSLLDRMRLPLGLATPLAAMSSSPAMQAYFRNDPLIGAKWIPGRFFRTVHQHRVTHWTLGCPILLVHPGADKWTPVFMSLPVFDRIGAPERFVRLTNGAHLPLEQPARQELLAQAAAFLDEMVGYAPCCESHEAAAEA